MRKDFLELTYKLRLRKIFISVLSVLILSFYILPRIAESDIMFEAVEQTEVIIVENPETQIQQQQFKSARPSIPIEADEDSDIDTLDFMDTDIEGFGDWGAPPPPPKSNSRPKWESTIGRPNIYRDWSSDDDTCSWKFKPGSNRHRGAMVIDIFHHHYRRARPFTVARWWISGSVS